MGWVRSNLEHVRRLRAKLEGGAFLIVQEDGTRQKVGQAGFYENFMRNSERLRAKYRGEEIPPPHPVGVALKGAANPLPQELQNAAENQRRLDRQLEEDQRS